MNKRRICDDPAYWCGLTQEKALALIHQAIQIKRANPKLTYRVIGLKFNYPTRPKIGVNSARTSAIVSQNKVTITFLKFDSN
jgi:hypothetical protein